MQIKKQVAVVTGGGSGMGAAVANMLYGHGAKVAVWDMNDEAGQKIAKEAKGISVVCDVSDEKSVEQALKTTIDAHGSAPRIVVNCAGILKGQRLLNREGPADLDHFEAMIKVNLMGTYNVMRLTGFEMAQLDPLDLDESRGVIINTASIAAYEGQIGQVGYSASKAGVIGMTLPAARELGKFGVRVMAIAPGAVETPMIKGVKDEIRQRIEKKIPFPQRFAKPDEFARLVHHIIDNNMLNGTCIRLDGASRLEPK